MKRQRQSVMQDTERKEQMEYSRLGAADLESEEIQENTDNRERIQQLGNYRYFSGFQIRSSVEVSKTTFLAGEKLYHDGKIEIQKINSGFDNRDTERKGQLLAIGKEGREEFPINIIFSRTKVQYMRCECRQCRRDYYEQYNMKKTSCSYKAGALMMLEHYLREHNIGDATDIDGQHLIGVFEERRANRAVVDMEASEEKIRLVPKLTQKNGALTLSFKVGTNKLFVVKKLDDFCENIKNSATDTYGSSTELNHDISHFTEEAKGWIRLINQIVREEEKFQQRLQESRYYYGYVKSSIGNSLDLFGWRLDAFFDQLGTKSIEFEDKDRAEKKKQTISCRTCNPKIAFRIEEDKIPGNREFHGIKAEGTLPMLYYGTDTAYFIGENYLNRVEQEFLNKIEPLAEVAEDGHFTFRVGRNHLSMFYRQIMPELREIAEITEVDPDKIDQYLMPEAQFIFYLDLEDEDVVCRISVRYGTEEISLLEKLPNESRSNIEPFRDIGKEQEILYLVSKWVPFIDHEKHAFCCDQDEETIYQLMKNGTEKLMELGEVQCTKRFLGRHTVSQIKVSVGVSVSSGLLELDIATSDVPAEELLDILHSYRLKKKYYRLKDGSFVDLEEPSMEMLSELSEAMNLKDKDLLKGKLKLPMYRTLYLDKLLEENESVYSSRDSHFREVVKEFKTIKDADFEIPKSLNGMMRKYQVDGYRWLRTLEAWKFGGILADDMGLGKTLQVIAVLLAAKEEADVSQKAPALIVTPASLVFNWGAEFEKFAPSLSVSLITGTQEERQKKIEAYQDADVLVTSYDLLKRDIAWYEDKMFAYEVIDEAQYIKNHTTAAAKAVKVIKSRMRYALTGTPIENRLSELWSIFDYLMPGFLYGYEVFKKEIETPIVKYQDEKAMQRLQKMVGPFILRRLKENVLKDLPEKLEEYRYVRLGDAQQKIYDGQVVHMREQLAQQNSEDFNKNKLRILAELTRLRQICCDPALCFENYKGEAAKLDACLELIQSAIDGDHRILVFSQFTSMLEILQKKLEKSGIAYFTITGSTSKENRLELVKKFNEGTVPVFLISLKAGGVGLNLTGADVVIHYDPWWNLAAQNQATDRAHRIGQTRKVTVYKLIARGTVEEKIQKLQETKKDLADQVMNGESGGLGSMSREEIMELLEVKA